MTDTLDIKMISTEDLLKDAKSCPLKTLQHIVNQRAEVIAQLEELADKLEYQVDALDIYSNELSRRCKQTQSQE